MELGDSVPLLFLEKVEGDEVYGLVIRSKTLYASGPEIRMTAIPALPGGVAKAYMVLRWASEGGGVDGWI